MIAHGALGDFGALAREHLANPRNRGVFPPEIAKNVLEGEAGSVASGAFVRFYLRVVDGYISAVRYEVLGGPALMAATSYLSELLPGCAAGPEAVPSGLVLAETLGLPRAEHGAALLAEDAAHACFASREN